jgi:lipopolysaccharide transport system permease protein
MSVVMGHQAERPPARAGRAEAADDAPLTVIEPRPGWRAVNLRELWRYREVLYFLTWRDIKVRYKQTLLGFAWSVLQPLSTVVVFVLFLGRLGNVGAGVGNYPLFVFAGILPWTFFANAVNAASTSVVGNQNLVSKVYFPRLLIPAGAVAANAFDFLIAFAMFAVAMACCGAAPGPTLVFAPLVLLLLAMTATGVGVGLSAVAVAHRDVRFALAFFVQLWMFATPTIYLPAEGIGPRGRAWLPLNPVYGLVYNFRQTMLGGAMDWYSLGVSAAVGVGLLLAGLFYFRRVERSFADII